jgi:hypothetical protein
MKRIFYLLIITILFVSFESCNAKEVLVQSKWTDSTIVVDGNPQDWGKFPMTYFEKAKVSLGAVNDSEYLYIMLSFRDQAPARFLQSKVTLWLDKTASKEKLLGFCYTGSPPESGLSTREGSIRQARRQEDSIPEPEENFTQRPAEIPGIITVLENKDTLGLIPTTSEKGPVIATSYQQGFYFHEIRIPLKRSDSTRYAIGAALGDTISVGLELGGFNPGEFRGKGPKSGERPGMGGEGGMPPEGGMPQGGGMGMGRQGGPGNRPQMPGKQEIWLKMSLAPSSQPTVENSKENK